MPEVRHPQQNGGHERMHLTLKLDTAIPPCGSRRAQQRAFNRFRWQCKGERPTKLWATAFRRSFSSCRRDDLSAQAT